MPAFTVETKDGLALARLNLPGESINKITRGVRDELDALLTAWASDSGVRAIVLLSGKPDTFIAGADIDEFVRLSSVAEARELVRRGQALIGRIAALGKPVVAAIHGACLGGGLEAALACSYRVATDHPKTVLGLPEVQLGIFPAAGGCQRLPRLIGARAALDMILTGKTLPASRAQKIGVVDEVVHPAILETVALGAAARMADGWRPRRPAAGRGITGLLLDRTPLGRRVVFALARRGVTRQTRGHYPAPLAALRAVAHGLAYGVEAGLEMEAALFAELAVGEVSRNLVRMFFATTALKKDPGVAGQAPPPRPVRNVAIVGAGFMGAAIGGVAVAQAGVDVRFRDTDIARVGQGLAAARKILDDRLKRRRITRFEHRRLAALLSGGTGFDGFGRADLVIEAVFEDLQVKHEVFRAVEAAVREDCILASNTSTIPIARVAEATQRPERVIGMHFFSPVERMPLLEVIVADRTAPETTVTAVAFGRRMGKTVIVVQDRPGFWVNRILAPYLNEAGRLLEEGLRIEELDAMMVKFGFPVGPLTLLDEVGLDVAAKSAGILHQAFGDRMAPAKGVHRLTQSGRLGRKNGRGFYEYRGGKRRRADRSVYELLGVAPRAAPAPEEALARMVYAMLNEAALALEEGVVRSARDGDIGAVFGIGYPAFRGGPLRYMDHLGPTKVVEELQRLEGAWGKRFQPAPMLRRLADTGGRFYSDA
ncbi:MAG TPA: 3-hydroxyacyl-CoA dehydrogenase NAD-binding domain-containing protein [Gemmatimonadales bacterium]|nr:3-hydroxyacyl-CoA dehydrogenase NAD-binding domain-containing protein [Gemmatimonadales bacterium]